MDSVKNVPAKTGEEKTILRQFVPDKKSGLKEILTPAFVILLIILAGVVSGYFFANRKGSSSSGEKMIAGNEKTVSGPEEMGVKDEKAFPDKAQGKVEVNDGKVVAEGSHKLIRPGGESQIAYLTSSVVDLNQFIGKCIEVWGETFAAQKAGWLMDIGYVKRLDKCPEGI